MKTVIQLKELSKLGYTSNIGRSIALGIIAKHCKHESKTHIVQRLQEILAQPALYTTDMIWGKLAQHFCGDATEKKFTVYALRNENDMVPCKVYGGVNIESSAKQQMHTALQLPVAIQGALMPDAHGGYGLPIGGVLATQNAVIPYAVGVDIGCRMALTIFSENEKYVQRYAYQVKEAIRAHTHFGMEGGLETKQQHAVLDSNAFSATPLLKSLHGKAARQLGSSGGGNHFVEFGTIEIYAGNQLGITPGQYTALLSHSGSRGLGAAIAMHYSKLARDTCKLPSYAQHLAWLDMNSEAGQEYWLSMNLAGDYAAACHERIHASMAKTLGLQVMNSISNHHNFAWQETINGSNAIVHRKGATPAHENEPGIIPGSMTTAGYLVCGKGDPQSLYSASHGAGRAMSRQSAKANFTRSALNKLLSQQQVTLIGGSTEEAPAAYKNIEQVMQQQQQLVTVQGKFMPRIVRMNKD
ncbi:RtcB family protein [Deminuibacter soli]|uniref:3'-phosphate/5'-hydroxy nucleic acid ligase n=1 Tax=Deminuibacter soli TaxID=2291815 RepID=A0A3E1NEU6_9BACT|nr:RtcB family protein [Deminuibacter soli]RFM26397.1 RtcB family protein [Deminuibacter soli]